MGNLCERTPKKSFWGKCWVCRWLYCHIDSTSPLVKYAVAYKFFRFENHCINETVVSNRRLKFTLTVHQNAVVMNFDSSQFMYVWCEHCAKCYSSSRLFWIFAFQITEHLLCILLVWCTFIFNPFCSVAISLVYCFATNSVNCMCDRVRFVQIRYVRLIPRFTFIIYGHLQLYSYSYSAFTILSVIFSVHCVSFFCHLAEFCGAPLSLFHLARQTLSAGANDCFTLFQLNTRTRNLNATSKQCVY